MKTKILFFFALLSLSLFLITNVLAETQCTEDGAVKCTDRLNAQICTDWDIDGQLEWGFCPLPNYGAQCLDKKAFLTIGVAVQEFGFTPEPPESVWNKQFACLNGIYYETSCVGNFINVRQTQCTYGCEGDKCKGLPPDECSDVGLIECNNNQYRTCLEGSLGNNVWSQFKDCSSGYTCVAEQGCVKDNPNPIDIKIILIVIAVALVAFGGYKLIKK